MHAVKFEIDTWRRLAVPSVATIILLSLSGPGFADSGFYAGGSVGSATVSADLESTFTFDENDFAWKAFGGYKFDLPVIELGIEGGYVDMGAPSASFGGQNFGLDLTGWDVFGLAGVQLGPVGVFAKAGYFKWDADVSIGGTSVDGDDGNDLAYGVGAKFGLGSIELRGEYEYFDVEGANDVYLLSVGLVYSFQ